jgi:hypothetical protein
LKTIYLPIGTAHVPFGELAHLIADALWPDAGPNDERLKYGAARVNLRTELAEAAESGALPLKDSLTLGPHTFPYGAARARALVPVDDLRAFVRTRGLSVVIDAEEGYARLEQQIGPYLDKASAELPDDLRRRVAKAFFPMPVWDEMTADQRLQLAKQHDLQHDPAWEPENSYWRGLEGDVWKTERDISMWEAMNAGGKPSEALLQENKLAELRERLSQLNVLRQLSAFTVKSWPVSDADLKKLTTASVEQEFTVQDGEETLTYRATRAEHEAMTAERTQRREQRQARGYFTLYEAAEVLANANGFDARDFLDRRMRPAVQTEALTLRDPIDQGTVTGRLCRTTDWVTPVDIDAWLEKAEFAYRWPRTERQSDQPQESTDRELPKPVQRSQAQDTAILSLLKARGYDPLALPRNPHGMPGVKAEVRKEVGIKGIWAGATVFEKAWERLRKRGDIADAK